MSAPPAWLAASIRSQGPVPAPTGRFRGTTVAGITVPHDRRRFPRFRTCRGARETLRKKGIAGRFPPLCPSAPPVPDVRSGRDAWIPLDRPDSARRRAWRQVVTTLGHTYGVKSPVRAPGRQRRGFRNRAPCPAPTCPGPATRIMVLGLMRRVHVVHRSAFDIRSTAIDTILAGHAVRDRALSDRARRARIRRRAP